MKIKHFPRLKTILDSEVKEVKKSALVKALLLTTLISTFFVLEALSFENVIVSHILIFCAFLLAIPSAIFLFRKSSRSPLKYALLILASTASLITMYIVSQSIANIIPLFSNALSYFAILIDLIIIYLLSIIIRGLFTEKGASSRLNNIFITVLLIIIISFSAYNNITNLSQQVFHQDERFSLQVAKGYYETGRYELWDFFNDISSKKPYTRNKVFTQMLAFTGSYLDFNEFSMRIPTATIAVLGTFTIFVITKKMTGSSELALVAALFWSFNDLVIYFGRFSRGYIFLMFFVQQILYLSWLLHNSNKMKYDLLALGLILIYFIVGYTFHQSILLITPIITIVLLVKYWGFINKHKKAILFILPFLIVLGGLVAFYSRIYRHFDFCITCEPQTIYFRHILEPFNFVDPLLFLFITFLLLSISTFKVNFRNISIISLYLSLLISIFLFNRYEDFRYVAVLQPLLILVFVYLIKFYTQAINTKLTLKNIFILLIALSLIKVQIPNITKDSLFTMKAQANWENIEGSRIHRRSARPDSRKTFDYIFSEEKDNITVLRLQDGGINWVDDYYISQYIKKYETKNFTLYVEIPKVLEDGTIISEFYEKYSTKRSSYKQVGPVLLTDILKNATVEDPIYIVSNTGNSTNLDVVNYLTTTCRDRSERIGTVKFEYLETKQTKVLSHFPTVLICD